MTTCFPLVEHHWRTCLTESAMLVLSSSASGFVAPSPSHLTSSLAQLRTSEAGQTTMTLSISCLLGNGDWRR